ncbi:hypothetical protein DRH27_01175 [Candidatus Falkowbacteria bacterium]|nr:MAG: hypothetical protein DRH27_01175 [Candidatus Falkowbacteria bacterium]
MDTLNKNLEKDNSLPEKKYKVKIHYYVIVSMVFILISLILFFWIYLLFNPGNNKINSLFNKLSVDFSKENLIKAKKDLNLVSRVIDGMLVEKGSENIFPTTVMIDNHTDARPPSALAKAQLVFETEAEGGITRYLAIFASNEKIEKIGPIRSARPYFIDWAREFSPLFVHVGGSPEALVKLNKENILHLNEFYNEDYFWRDKTQGAPHNVYTSSEFLEKYLNNKNLVQGSYFSWEYKDDKIFSGQNQDLTIKVNFNLPKYIVEWKYDSNSNGFVRYLDSSVHKTTEGDIITAKNIIIQYIESWEIDDELRLKVENIGSGDAVVCLDGECAPAYWKKNNSSARTRFYEKNSNYEKVGAELKFNRGTTWIEAVNPEIIVEY